MQFTSFSFLLFLPVVFLGYYLIGNKNYKSQNILLLLASYYFYGNWDWRFTGLLFFSTLLDYFLGIQIHQRTDQRIRKQLLAISVVLNLGFLCFFKYFNFFSGELQQLFQNFGITLDGPTLNILLPVGISFYTFHGLSYIFDIYNRRISPCTDPVNYFLFVSFFPLLVAGPIERATHLLPQIQMRRTFSYPAAADGMRQILWGLFKKMVVADGCARFANHIFSEYETLNGATLALGAFLFAFQIYGDFSGYSDIALGVARLFGFELLHNFNYPYFSRSITEFWKRWHISLTSFFRDYVFIPLGGSRKGKLITVRNILIIFLLSGMWHGANWTFLFWGGLNALFLIPPVIRGNKRKYSHTVAEGKWLPGLTEMAQMVSTFIITAILWIFFRSDSIQNSFSYLKHMMGPSLFANPDPDYFSRIILAMISLLLITEWSGRTRKHALEGMAEIGSWPVRWFIYLAMGCIIFFFASGEQRFIYFQF